MTTRMFFSGVLFLALCSTACDAEEPASKEAKGHPEGCNEGGNVESRADAVPFRDEPAAHALYDKMVETMRKADSLSYVSRYDREARGRATSACIYRVWLKKPNCFRVETQSVSGERGGILIGDGGTMWIYWPNGRPKWRYFEQSATDKQTRFSSYMTKPAPPLKTSILHETPLLGAGMGNTILDPSAFHGLVSSLEPHLDGVRHLGTEIIAGEACEKIEVSFMSHQRSRWLWLSKRDCLPRKLKEVVRVDPELIFNEKWSEVRVDGDIPEAMFVWKPPKGWTRWRLPDKRKRLVRPGLEAPDFELPSVDGKRIKLSDYRGKTVLLCFWRVGCPPCREEIPHVQDLYARYKGKGLVVLGVNVSDDKDIALEFLCKRHVTFPCILDTSDNAEKVCGKDYGGVAVPTNYVINADGNIVDAWYGYEEGDPRAMAALEKAGGELAKALRRERDAKAAQSAEAVADAAPFRDEPAAHALYDKMIEAMHRADSLSFVSRYEWEFEHRRGNCTYRVWLKKPNYFRLETRSSSGDEGGVIVGDGGTMWTYWPKGRPKHPLEDTEAYEKTRLTSYMKDAAPLGGHSIGHETEYLGVGLIRPVLDPSMFHDGIIDGLQSYLDGVEHLGTERVGAEECDKIEISFMDHQRSWHLWLSKQDHLPRKLKDIVRVSSDCVIREQWSSVALNEDISDTMFAWKPPKGWTQWKEPPREAGLLKPGTKAPDFELASTTGTPIRLSDYRGRVVWLCIWRVGCPPCRRELPFLEKLYSNYKDKGLTILGVNCHDDKRIAMDVLLDSGVDFPNIVDSSESALEVCLEVYQKKGWSVMPLNYIIDREGRVVDAWYGYRSSGSRAMAALEKAGGELAEALRREWDAKAAQSAEAVADAARRLFEAIRSADCARFLNTRDGEGFLQGNGTDYMVDSNYSGWVRWMCRKFKDNPIADVRLGRVFAGHVGAPTVHYRLRLRNGEMLEGDLPFQWDSKEERWTGKEGLDWHLEEKRVKER